MTDKEKLRIILKTLGFNKLSSLGNEETWISSTHTFHLELVSDYNTDTIGMSFQDRPIDILTYFRGHQADWNAECYRLGLTTQGTLTIKGPSLVTPKSYSYEISGRNTMQVNRECSHKWKRYQGFREVYRYCEYCDKKEF